MRKHWLLISVILSMCIVSTVCGGFTISGKIIDPELFLFKQLMDEGVAPRGFDAISCRVIQVRAFGTAGTIVMTNPDSTGVFTLICDKPVTAITVESGGGGAYYKITGKWADNEKVDIVIEPEKVITLKGYIRNVDGSVKKREMVSAFDWNDVKLAFAYTNSKGYYEIYSNVEIDYIKSHANRQEVRKRGPWKTDAIVNLGMAQTGRFTLRGKVTDSNGNPMRKFRVLAYDTKDKNLTAVLTDQQGNYTITTDRPIGALRAYRKTGQEYHKTGPWDTDTTVDITFSNKGVFTISGRVTDVNGHPAKALISYSAGGIRLGSVRNDKKGRYSFTVDRQISFIVAESLSAKEYVERHGKWNSDQTLDFIIK